MLKKMAMSFLKFLPERVHFVKSVRIWSNSSPYFHAFALNMKDTVRMREYTNQNKSEYKQFLRSGCNLDF